MGVEAGGYLDRPEEEMRKLKRVVYAAHALGIYVIAARSVRVPFLFYDVIFDVFPQQLKALGSQPR